VPPTNEKWQPARLFPITGIGGADEQERRGCSALLAVVQSVHEFGRALTMRCGAPAGSIETFIEVPFTLNGADFRPDGLIRVTRGQKSWIALLEVKTGRNDLKPDQITNYLDIAREQGFDAVITISHEVATTPGVHPVPVDKRKLKKVGLYHLSWSRIQTEALIEQSNHLVSDPDQAWILSEFVRYVTNPKSGAWDFDDMGPDWVAIRNASALQTVRTGDRETLNVVAKFDQLLAYCGMELSRSLGVNVQQRLTRKERNDHAARLQAQAARLAKSGELTGSLVVPNAIAPIDVVVDLRASRVDCSATFDAPSEGRPNTRINWLLRQLKDAPANTMVVATSVRAKDSGPCHPLGVLKESPAMLVESPQAEIKSFTVTLSHATGAKQGRKAGSFVKSVTDLVDSFYGEILQSLRPWSAPAPKPKQPPYGNAQEVEPPPEFDGSFPAGLTEFRSIENEGWSASPSSGELPEDSSSPPPSVA
jgi:hypothetical protein